MHRDSMEYTSDAIEIATDTIIETALTDIIELNSIRAGTKSVKTPFYQPVENSLTEAAQDGKFYPVLERCINSLSQKPTVLKILLKGTERTDDLEQLSARFLYHEMVKHS